MVSLKFCDLKRGIVHIAGREVYIILHLELPCKFRSNGTVDKRQCASVELYFCRDPGFDALTVTEDQALVGYFEECHRC